MNYKLKFLLFQLLILGSFNMFAQQTTLTTTTTFLNNNGSGTVIFNLQNTNSYPIKIKQINGIASTTSTAAVQLFYNVTPIAGVQPSISATDGWILAASNSITGITNSTTTVTQPFLTGLNFEIPANTTYGIAVFATSQRYSTIAAGTTTISNGGVNLITGTNIGYAGNTPPTAPTISPRGWIGDIVFEPAFKPYNNASVSELIAPINFCSGTKDIKIKVKNKGGNVISSLFVNWELDNVLQTPVYIFTPLDTIGHPTLPSDTIITLGSIYFGSSAHTLKAWTSLPNNIIDTVNADDTINVTMRASLNGTYTIGGATPDYTNFTNAISDLNNFGVCGPVIFNVASGSPTFNEALDFGDISGTSNINTIKFNGNGNTITSLTSPLVKFAGSKYITIDSLNIIGATGFVGFGVHIGSQSKYITINKCSVDVGNTSTLSSTSGIVVSGSTTAATTAGNNAQYVSLTNNTVFGGYYGITMTGNASYLDNYKQVIKNNKVTSFYLYGIYLANSDSCEVEGNDINRLNRPTFSTFYGIYSATSRNLKIKNNIIREGGTASYTAYPIYLSTSANSIGYETELVNNLIYNINTTSTFYGIYALGTLDRLNIYHNTIQHTSSGAGTVRNVFFSGAPNNVTFKNNILTIDGSGTGTKISIYVTTTSTSFVSNNNIIYNASTTGTNVLGYWTANRSTLADWSTASSQDLNSYNLDPNYSNITSGNFVPTNSAVDNIGAPVGVLTDIVGVNRSLTTPDAGAFESAKKLNNAGVKELVSPLSFCSGNYDVKVNIANNGGNLLNSVTINWELDAIAQSPIYWTGQLDSVDGVGKKDTIITLGNFSFVSGINRTLKVWTSMPNAVNDTYHLDDTIFVNLKPTISGAYTIGATGDYTTLTAAALDIQSGACGPLVFELQSNYNPALETFPILINPSGLNPLNTITIRPAFGVTAINITSSNSVATLNLNGAKHLIIDGRAGGIGTKVLEISNTSTTGSAVQFINDAQFVKLTNITFTANNSNAASGVILFGATNGTTGNSNIVIDSCVINGNSASVNCVYSSGSAAPADNKDNTIINCNIFDFFSNVASTNTSGITLVGGNSNWNIGTLNNGNNIYQTAPRNSTTTPALTNAVFFKAVFVNDATAGGINVVGNNVGGNINNIPSSIFSIGDSLVSLGHKLWLIDIYAASNVLPSLVKYNTISDVVFYSSITNSFIGIHGRMSAVSILNNTIGSNIGNDNIKVFHTGAATSANYLGIRYEAAIGSIENNIIGSFTGEVKNATGTMQLLCIYLAGALTSPVTIANNYVGSTVTSNSVQSTAASIGGVNIMGIVTSSATGAPINIINNNINNISSFCSAVSATNGLKGIYITGPSSLGNNITGNTISNFYSVSNNPGSNESAAVIGISTVSSLAGSQVISGNTIKNLILDNAVNIVSSLLGIYYASSTTSTNNSIDKNSISNLVSSANNPLAIVNGILISASGGSLGSSAARVGVSNNMISLGYDTNGVPLSGAFSLNGISKTGASASVYFNTISIAGTGVKSDLVNSYAYVSTTTSADTLLNNIFVNTRANSTTGGTHYAIGLSSVTGTLINYNLYYTNSSPLGLFVTANQSDLLAWKTATSQDANSANAYVSFVSATNLHLTGSSIGDMQLKGLYLPAITTDIDNQLRNSTSPYMGADENLSSPLPIKLLTFSAAIVDENVHLNWTTASEINSAHFIVEASADGVNFKAVGKVLASGNSSTITKYNFVHNNAQRVIGNTIFYRLVAVDFDGLTEKSEMVNVKFGNKVDQKLALYPNPFSKSISVSYVAATAGNATIQVTDLTGKVLLQLNKAIKVGANATELTELENLKQGIYILKLQFGDEQLIQKIIKQ